MSFGPDLHSLDAAATQLNQHSAELRSRAIRLHRASESIDWRSSAARAFQQHNATVCGQLQRSADLLEQASTRLRRHADTARDRLGAAEGVISGGLHGLGAVAGGVSAGLHLVGR
jgi:ABC-type transporter Mla subunit MlaD